METAELVEVDAAGLALLAELSDVGVELAGLSPYLTLRLAGLSNGISKRSGVKSGAIDHEARGAERHDNTKEAGKR